jgi:hypothetical protein
MTGEAWRSRLRSGPFLIAVIVSAVLVLSAPFVGRIRGQIRAAFPGQFVTIVGGAIAVAIAAALIVAHARIRDRRALRYGLIALSLVLGTTYAYSIRTGNAEVDAVELFHFVSYGLVTLLFYHAWRPLGDGAVFVLPVLCALMVGTVDEWFQWFIPNRIGELRDVFLNGAAIATGLLFSLGLDPPNRFTVRTDRTSRMKVRRVLAATVVVIATFISIVHLGYTVQDNERAFKSIYSGGELDRLAADRIERWRTNPPLVLQRFSEEDQYMSEALWHIQRRNRAWDAGDVGTAVEENLILERFYAPVLDTPSFVSKTGHRWSPEHRNEADTRLKQRPSAPTRYVSDANTYPIFTWSRTAFWMVVAALVMLMLVPLPLRREA